MWKGGFLPKRRLTVTRSRMVLNQLGIAHVTVSVAKKPAPGAGPGAG